MAYKKLKTYEDMLGEFAESIPPVLDDIKANIKQLQLDGRDNDVAKVHRTRKILKKWFVDNARKY